MTTIHLDSIVTAPDDTVIRNRSLAGIITIFARLYAFGTLIVWIVISARAI